MIRFILAVGTLALAMSGRHVSAAVTLPDFDNAAPGTVAVLSKQETSSADRLPDSGSAISANGPNLVLDTLGGRFFETSRRYNFGNSVERPALLIRRDARGVFAVRANFRDPNADTFDTGTNASIGLVNNELEITTPQVAALGHSGLSTGISVPEPTSIALSLLAILFLFSRRHRVSPD